MLDTKYWVAFNRIPGIGRAKFALLEKHFGTLDRAWHAGPQELKAAGLDETTVRSIVARRPAIDPEAEMDRLWRLGIRAIAWNDPAYPPHLKQIYDWPPVLYVKGSLLPQDQRSITVVGTRRATAYGKEVTSRLTAELVRHGITVVSGLARGIDAVAHQVALDEGGRTLAVLAGGLDRIYPPEHSRLAQEIARRGALISEHPPGVRPDPRSFPRRNRILSGLSLGTLVIEAGEVSGALWTVHHALEQNREVFAVPGSIFSPQSRGTNRLIQDGAKLVLDIQDVLEELNITSLLPPPERPREPPAESDIEAALLKHLSPQPLHIDDLRRLSGLPIATVSSTLAMMEVKGLVRNLGGMQFVRVKEPVAEYEGVP